ncbi:hypothetical protein HELRODRAFT_166115 [Helobdella robusta]|uniref:Uncharacterized protein n=1 Tax=Helobdella robusta TaxID=6412 RepID=T1EXS7_HELRO|nr:hypothetical protein HELRODRAFT_166115 [Helobdella robusta]ESN90449.1 hypothetical protein HELRODRAFT_166115 [Helobdella robusta]
MVSRNVFVDALTPATLSRTPHLSASNARPLSPHSSSSSQSSSSSSHSSSSLGVSSFSPSSSSSVNFSKLGPPINSSDSDEAKKPHLSAYFDLTTFDQYKDIEDVVRTEAWLANPIDKLIKSEDTNKSTASSNNAGNTNSNFKTVRFVRSSGLIVDLTIETLSSQFDFVDVEHEKDDNEFMMNKFKVTEEKDRFKHVLNNLCRHPVPNFYILTLDVFKERITTTNEVTCSYETANQKCPFGVSEGESFLNRSLNEQCAWMSYGMKNIGTLSSHAAACMWFAGVLR